MAEMLRSIDPASGEIVWEQPVSSAEDCAAALATARAQFASWSRRPLAERIAMAQRYAEVLEARRDALAEAISRETGKLMWETRTEIGSMIGKVAVSIQAQAERAGERAHDTAFGRAVLRHRPHGVMAVLGPYNFPGHLPNGHIVPALLAGNTVVFKPSEETPWTGQLMAEAWRDAGLPAGVFNLVQGARDTGAALIAGDVDGLLFTGSAEAGAHFRRAFVDRPHVILALELGGNNPLITWDGDPQALASTIIQSAYITTGQRCSCARRLIVPAGSVGDAIVDALVAATDRIKVGAWSDNEQAYIGPMISERAATKARSAVEQMVAAGAREIRGFSGIEGRSGAFVTPAIYDATGVSLPDTEIFAPVLQVHRVGDFDAAVRIANDTAFGLTAGLLTADDALWERFVVEARAGIVNRNRPTTGAAANMPFGGLGLSGNHRPSAYYAADYCAYPMASFEADAAMVETLPGVG